MTDELARAHLAVLAVPRVLDPRDHRALEHRRGRQAAQQALAALGGRGVIGGGAGERPRWPTGFVGSISHGAGRAAAVVARRDALVAPFEIGVDIEARLRVDPAVVAGTFTPRELDRRAAPSAPEDVLVLSAKESVVKAGGPLQLAAIDLRFDGGPRSGRFSGAGCRGRWWVGSDWVLTVALAVDR